MPPKKQKQTPRNGFYYFMLEFKSTQGRNYNSMREVADAAGPHWSRMSKEQRKPYEEKALYEKNNMRPGKYTSDGVDIKVIEQQEREEQQRIEDMKIKTSDEIKLAAKNGSIQDKLFFLIHINSFCYCSSEERYYPAEIGVCAFNLINGVLPEDVFHSIIKPGPLPLGYAAEAQTLSNETHQIHPPMLDETENNIEEVFYKMKQFVLSRTQGSKKTPILYCHESYMKMVQQIVDTWCYDYNDPISFKIFNLQYMFRVLKNTVAGDNVWPSDTFSVREIEKDVNAYAKGIGCEYHEYTNVPVYCSRSIVVRTAYTICDNCCQYLNIQFIPGCHVPHSASVGSTRPSSVASGRSSKSSISKSYSVRDDDTDSVISVSSKSEWDNRSVTSDVSTINDDDGYPSLGARKKCANSGPGSWQFSPNDTSSLCSQSSGRSYAGATGTAGLSRRAADIPSCMTDRLEKLSVCSSNASNSSLGKGSPPNFNAKDEFPSLGQQGKNIGPRGRGIGRPNKE